MIFVIPSSQHNLNIGTLCRDGDLCKSAEPIEMQSDCVPHMESLYIKRGKVPARTSVTVGVASSVPNDVTMRMTSE